MLRYENVCLGRPFGCAPSRQMCVCDVRVCVLFVRNYLFKIDKLHSTSLALSCSYPVVSHIRLLNYSVSFSSGSNLLQLQNF